MRASIEGGHADDLSPCTSKAGLYYSMDVMISLKIFSNLIVIFLLGFYGTGYVSAATFYVSASGNDGNSGLSPEKAWRTATRVNQVIFSPGDRILFEGGKIFRGPVKFNAKDGGSADHPLILGSYRLEEAGPAIIAAYGKRGIDVYNASGLCISDLKIIGSGPKINRTSGILLHTSRPEGASHVTIDNVEVSGFGKHGISIGAWKSSKGYGNVSITRTKTHDNLRTGILSWGPWGPGIYAHSKIYIGYCEAYNMKGGSGITLSSVNGAIIERSIAHDNGEKFSGAAGIWAWDSNNITIQFNESYNNRTTDVDGDGFDFDGGVTNSIMQYNYSHDNDAAGYLLAQYPGAPQAMSNIIIRYNISENDCRKKGYGAIHLWNGEGADRMEGIHIYQNTIYLDSSPGDRPSAITVATPTTSIFVRNNLFYTSGGEALVSVAPDQDGILFQNNAYWSESGDFRINWKGDSFSCLNSWLNAANEQERMGSTILAIHADPLLKNPGRGGTLRNPDLLFTLSAYQLQKGSPLIQRGLVLSALGIDPGRHGFFGTPISEATPPAIGANVSRAAL